jgi:hypothetical protein
MAYNPNAVWTSKKETHSAVTPPPSEPPKNSGTPPPSGPEPKKQPEQAPRVPSGPSFFRRHALVLFASGLVVLLGVALGIAFYLRPAPSPSASIAFSQPDKVPVGAPTAITISSSNNSTVQATKAILTVTLPDNISFVGDDPSERTKEYSIGDINPGTIVAQSSTIIVTGKPEQLQRINAKLTYGTPSSTQAQFETDGETNVMVGDSAISLSYTAPQNIVSGQSFSFTVNYQNNTAQNIDNVSVQLSYLPAFTLATSSIPTTGANNTNTWNIGTIPGGINGSFTVTGTIIGQTKVQYPMSGTVFLGISGQNYPVNVQTLAFAVSQPPLSLTITPNTSTTYISKAGDNIDYILAYTNNSNVNFASVNISANLVGSMFDFASLKTDGAFNSRTNTITWSAANAPALTSVAPGQSGSIEFSIKTKTSYPIKLSSDKDYLLMVTGTIQSPTVPPNTAGSSTISVATQQNKVSGAIDLTAKGLLKSGTYPPKVNQETQYAVQWDIVNYSTDAQNVKVSAYLQSGTTLTGTATSNIASAPIYDPGTGLISWTIPGIAAGTGVITKPIEAVFNITNTPAVNQVGTDVTLLGKSSLTATDAFTGQALQSTTDVITTALPDDASIARGQDTRVTQ